MAKASCSDKEFIELFQKHGSPSAVAAVLGINVRNVYVRRRAIEARENIELVSGVSIYQPADGMVWEMDIQNGTILAGSDAHYWPGHVSTAHRAFVHLTKKLKPAAVVMNGDVFDGAQISRHDRIRWDSAPSVQQELEAVVERLGEVEKAAKGATLIRTRGNHDDRYENRLSKSAPEYEGLPGTTLKEHLPKWHEAMAVRVNQDQLFILHNDHNGIHAAYNNVIKSGMSVCTGHLHALQVTAWSDLTGTKWGIDCGTLADTEGPQFRYMNGKRRNWRSGFAVLTFVNGQMLYPEIVYVIEEGLVSFRGQVLEV